MCAELVLLTYHFGVSYIIPPFWWKLPNFSTEFSFFFLSWNRWQDFYLKQLQ